MRLDSSGWSMCAIDGPWERGVARAGETLHKPFSLALLHAAATVTRGRRYAFLQFHYDEEAAKLRETNNEFLGEASVHTRASQLAPTALRMTFSGDHAADLACAVREILQARSEIANMGSVGQRQTPR